VAQLVRIVEMINIMLAPLQERALAIRPMLDFFDAGSAMRHMLIRFVIRRPRAEYFRFVAVHSLANTE